MRRGTEMFLEVFQAEDKENGTSSTSRRSSERIAIPNSTTADFASVPVSSLDRAIWQQLSCSIQEITQ